MSFKTQEKVVKVNKKDRDKDIEAKLRASAQLPTSIEGPDEWYHLQSF